VWSYPIRPQAAGQLCQALYPSGSKSNPADGGQHRHPVSKQEGPINAG